MIPLLMLACAIGSDTGGDTAAEAPTRRMEAPERGVAPEPIEETDACPGATLAPGMLTLDRTWAMATWDGCATGVRLECPAWVTVDTSRSVVTGDVALFMAGPLAQDGAPRVARCGIVTDQGRGEVVIVWEG
jgi:hypothetical protein